MRLVEYLKRIQNLPLIKRKIIFWIILIIFGLVFFTLYIINIEQRIETFPKEKALEELNFPKIEEELKNLPKFEMPKLEIEENLKKLEEMQKEIK
jgi:hypothetical protein